MDIRIKGKNAEDPFFSAILRRKDGSCRIDISSSRSRRFRQRDVRSILFRFIIQSRVEIDRIEGIGRCPCFALFIRYRLLSRHVRCEDGSDLIENRNEMCVSLSLIILHVAERVETFDAEVDAPSKLLHDRNGDEDVLLNEVFSEWSEVWDLEQVSTLH